MLDYLRLVRFPLVFTVLGDLWLGYATAMGSWALPRVGLWLAGPCFYLAGMALNDWADRDRDRSLHPERPLPRGRIPAQHALLLGVVLLAIGLGLCWAQPDRRTFALGASLGAMVVAYDLGLKRWALPGAIALGACRGLNVLLGVAGAGAALGQAHAGTAAATVVACYGFALTWVSTLEETRPWAGNMVRWGLWGYFPLEAGLAAATGLGPAAAFPLGLAALAAGCSRSMARG